MQSVRFVMREVGTGAGMLSAADFSEYVEYNYLGNGYVLWKQSEYPVMNGNDFLGMRVFLTLVRDEEVKSAKK